MGKTFCLFPRRDTKEDSGPGYRVVRNKGWRGRRRGRKASHPNCQEIGPRGGELATGVPVWRSRYCGRTHHPGQELGPGLGPSKLRGETKSGPEVFPLEHWSWAPETARHGGWPQGQNWLLYTPRLAPVTQGSAKAPTCAGVEMQKQSHRKNGAQLQTTQGGRGSCSILRLEGLGRKVQKCGRTFPKFQGCSRN